MSRTFARRAFPVVVFAGLLAQVAMTCCRADAIVAAAPQSARWLKGAYAPVS